MKTYHKRNTLIQGYHAMEHPNYNIWSGIKSRCNNQKEPAYKNYGGRGITYCAEWDHFENFCLDMGIRPSHEYSIERINNDGNYEPSNCKWATRHEQSMNRRKFKNNTTGQTGVKRVENGRYSACVNYKKTRFNLAGTFKTIDEAVIARCKLLAMLKSGVPVNKLIERKARYDSSTGIKGISRHVDGGYLIRATINGKRKYLGYKKDLEQAKEVLKNAKT